MTKEEQEEIMELLRGRDVSEVLSVLMHTGNRYSRRTLRFFQMVLQVGASDDHAVSHVRHVGFRAQPARDVFSA